MSRVSAHYWDVLRSLFVGKPGKPITLKQGRWKEFNKHAILIAEGHYLNGQKQGKWREYFDTGELMLEEEFEEGISNGRFASYHRNGSVLSEGLFKNGLRTGEFKVYDERGMHIKSLWFIDDCLTEEIEHKKLICL